jgi:hypothetical protein
MPGNYPEENIKAYRIQVSGNYPEENISHIKFRRQGITQKKTYRI